MSTAEILIAGTNPTERRSFLVRAVQIALSTCLQHWLFWMWVFFAGFMAAWTMNFLPNGSHPAQGIQAQGLVWLWPFLTLYTGGLVPVLFAEHLVWDRNQLVPNFRRVHLAAMALAALAMLSLVTAWLDYCCPVSIWPMSGAALLAFALGGWSIGRRLVVVVMVTGIVIILLSLKTWSHAVLDFAQTTERNLAMGLIGCVILGFLVRWFWRLDEDSSGFDFCRQVAKQSRFVVRMPRRHSWSQPDLARGGGQSSLSWPAALVYQVQDWRLDSALRQGRSWPGWSMRRWELAWPDMMFAWTAFAGIWCAMLPISLIAWRWGGWESAWLILRGTVMATGALVQIAVLVIPHIERRSMLGYESLRPVTRRKLLRQWGAALLWRMMAGGLSLGVLFCILCVLTASRFHLVFVLAWGFYLLAVLATYAALLILLRTIGGEVLQGVAGVVGSILYYYALGLLGAYLSLFQSSLLVAAVATALAAAGAAILLIAYRRWLVADLE